MISQVIIQNFKRFKAPTEFVLKPEGVTFLAGGNNSGKSTLLQALAVWDFARSVIEVNKGKVALLAGTSGQGVGVSAEEFSPIAIPSLKHLWSDLKISNSAAGNGYTLRIRCSWQTTSEPLADRYLGLGSHSRTIASFSDASSQISPIETPYPVWHTSRPSRVLHHARSGCRPSRVSAG